jgi:hypothetical protein
MNKEQLQVLLMESLVKPGPAISIFSTSAESGKLALIFCANSLGAHPACLDNIIAIFEAKSPWVSIINGIVGIAENTGRVGEGT